MPNIIEVLLPILLYTFTLLLGGSLSVWLAYKCWQLLCWIVIKLDDYAKDVSRHNRRLRERGSSSHK